MELFLAKLRFSLCVCSGGECSHGLHAVLSIAFFLQLVKSVKNSCKTSTAVITDYFTFTDLSLFGWDFSIQLAVLYPSVSLSSPREASESSLVQCTAC